MNKVKFLHRNGTQVSDCIIINNECTLTELMESNKYMDHRSQAIYLAKMTTIDMDGESTHVILSKIAETNFPDLCKIMASIIITLVDPDKDLRKNLRLTCDMILAHKPKFANQPTCIIQHFVDRMANSLNEELHKGLSADTILLFEYQFSVLLIPLVSPQQITSSHFTDHFSSN